MQFGAVKLTEFGNQKLKARVDRRLGPVRLSQMVMFQNDSEHKADYPEQNPQ